MSTITLPYRYKMRGDTATVLAARNEVLLEREWCFETDTGRAKQGDGNTPWNDLPYASPGYIDFTALADGYALTWDAASGMLVFSPGGGYSDEQAQDAVGAMVSGTGDVPLVYTDATPLLAASLSNTGVTAGSYTSANITVDAKGRITAAASGSAALTYVGTATVTGSPATSLTMSGLNLGADGQYFIEFAFANATASTVTSSLFINGDTALANYTRQSFTVSGSTPSGSRSPNADNFSMLASSYATGTLWYINDRSGRPISITDYLRGSNSNTILHKIGTEYEVVANLTSITFTSSVANAYEVGSYFKVWKRN